MTRNNLFLNRLVIFTNEGNIAYDEKFHKGVNIIRGENSSGKSTITHFIFFALGGAFSDFVPEAKLCSTVFAEVEMNGAIITLKRDIEINDKERVNTQTPMNFFWGNYEEAINPPTDKNWQKFGYRLTDNRKSFSNVMFENLGLPIVKGNDNITIHQILRLLYIDQDSPTSSLFYYEQFDSQLTRETVSDLLLGVYNEELYENNKRLIDAEKELDGVRSEIKATKQFFQDPLMLNPEHIRTTIQNRESEISKIEDEIVAIRNKKKEIAYDKDSKLEFQKLNEQALEQRFIVTSIESEIADLNSEIEDSEFFITTLTKKIGALRNSIQTREFLGNLPIEYCPECLTKLKPETDENKCKLCKENIDETFGVVQARRLEQEISFQIHESQKLLESNRRILVEKESSYQAELVKLQHIQRQVNSALHDVKSYNDEMLDALNNQKGFLEGEILQFKTMLENAELFDRLYAQKVKLEKEVEFRRAYKFNTEKKQEQLKIQISNAIREEGVYLLNNDLERQDEFKRANEFFIDFSNNIAFLSNKYSKYSASSNFYLKVSARFALFLASLSIAGMRYPRFIFADNMEDKGIEMLRAQNLQKLLIERTSKFADASYQMIYTTSYITDELNKSRYVVGEYYTKDNKTLKNIKR